MHPHAAAGQQGAQRLGHGKRGRLGDRVGRRDRYRSEGHYRHVVDDDSPGLSQRRQEGLGHAVGTEEVDRQVPLDRGQITQVVVQRDAGVVDQDIERSDLPGRFPDLRRAGHIQDQRRDPVVGVGNGLARAGVHPPRAPAQGFLDQGPPDPAVGSGHQDGAVCNARHDDDLPLLKGGAARLPTATDPGRRGN
jgi:hypothetical protein